MLDYKYVPTKRIGYSLKPNRYQINDINIALKNILPDKVKISISIYEKIYKFNFNIIQTLIFTDEGFFYTILVFFNHIFIL